MNDLFFIRYEAKRMLVDTLDMPPDVELAHRRLCDFIWAMDGPPDDNPDILPGLGRADSTNWARIRGGLEKKGWKSQGGKFTHNGATTTLSEAHEEYQGKCDKTEAARKALKEKRDRECNRDSNNDCHKDCHSEQSQSQSQSQSEEQPQRESTRAPDAEIPSWDEIKTEASMRAIPEASAKNFFDYHQDNNLWLNRCNRAINWRSKLRTWAIKDRNGTSKSTKPNPRNVGMSADPTELSRAIAAKIKRDNEKPVSK